MDASGEERKGTGENKGQEGVDGEDVNLKEVKGGNELQHGRLELGYSVQMSLKEHHLMLSAPIARGRSWPTLRLLLFRTHFHLLPFLKPPGSPVS